MPDRENVVKGLEDISDYFYHLYRDVDDREEYAKHHERMSIVDDAIALLKEQEAVEPTWSRGKPFCGACGLQIRGGKFCSECGKPILWKGR